uniref:Uncharacterized protein n=1 Tax=Anguilla anguilla TaxID=7936 RepID=A0A0E9SVD4_ANGAN
MEPRGLVCLNDRTGTRVNIAIGTDLAIDLTLITKSLAGGCSWEVMKESTVGSDRYPILKKMSRLCPLCSCLCLLGPSLPVVLVLSRVP